MGRGRTFVIWSYTATVPYAGYTSVDFWCSAADETWCQWRYCVSRLESRWVHVFKSLYISFSSFWDRILLCSYWLIWNSKSSACLCCPPHPTPDTVLQFWDISPGQPCYVYSSHGTWVFLILLILFLVLGLKGRVATPHWESCFFCFLFWVVQVSTHSFLVRFWSFVYFLRQICSVLESTMLPRLALNLLEPFVSGSQVMRVTVWAWLLIVF